MAVRMKLPDGRTLKIDKRVRDGKVEPKSAKEIYDRWYQDHKEELNAKRRLRYQTDAEYRTKIQDRVRKSRENKAK